MKKISTLFCAGVLMSVLCVGFVTCNEPNGAEQSDEQRRIEMAKLTDDVYYVVGSNAQAVVAQGDGTAKCGVYLLISENLQDTVSVYNYTKDGFPGNLFDGIFEFPTEIMATNICGFTLFHEEYRYLYPVKINSYRPMTAEEEMGKFSACNAMILVSPIKPNKSVFVESLTKL